MALALVFLLALAWLLGLAQKLPDARALAPEPTPAPADLDADGVPDVVEDALLERHRPVFVLSRKDPSRPASIPWLRARVDLPLEPRLAGILGPARRFEADTRRGPDGLGDRRIYAHAYPRAGGGLVLQYWNYYPYNEGPLFFDHESDWEHVSVLLGADEEPLEVAYSRHDDNAPGVRRPWRSAPREGDRPVVLVASGTHASYAWAREAPFWEQVPDCPRTPGGGPRADCVHEIWRPAADALLNVGERSAPRTEREADAFFVRYGGLWGGPLFLGSGIPSGPPFQRGFCSDGVPGRCR